MQGSPGSFPGTERFEVRRCLGSGGFGTVYEALDRKRGAAVALKVLRAPEASQILRFKQEFRALSGITHPNLVTLYELGSEGDHWFFSMELIRGSDFLGYVSGSEDAGLSLTPPTSDGRATVATAAGVPSTDPGAPTHTEASLQVTAPEGPAAPPLPRPFSAPPPPSSLGRLVRSLRQLAEGLQALHGEGKIHRDIKPANVLCTREGRVVILDFGILRDLNMEHGDMTRDLSGTPFYMAPEQVQEQPITPAADWYSVGVLLYQALTGVLPFTGTALQVLRSKVSRDPPPPSTLRPGIPPILDALCVRMLSRAPEGRPGGSQLIAELIELESSFGAPTSAGGVSPPSLPSRSLFVGRSSQLSALQAAYEEAAQGGKAVVALCSGGSGAGKSTLCRRFLRQLSQRDDRVVTFTGRCFEHEDVPFKALDGVIDALSRYLRRSEAEAHALLPRGVASLTRLFPVLLQVPAIQEAPRRDLADSTQVRRAASTALRELLLRLCDRRPVVIYIDDLQWGDLDSVSLLLELLRPPEPPPLLLLLSYRAEEEQSSSVLAALKKGLAERDTTLAEIRTIQVGELPEAEAQELVRSLAPELSQEQAAALAAEGRGNAFFVTELSRSSVALTVGEEKTLDALLQRRIARLPPEARRLLEVVTVAGQPVPRAVASLASFGEEEREDEPKALATLRAERLIRVRHAQEEPSSDPREELLPYHDRIREAVVSALAPSRLASLHLGLADALRCSGVTEPERLVFHLLRGGDLAAASRRAVEASEAAVRAFAYHQTAELCRAALGTGELSEEEIPVIKERLADALTGLGRPKEAADAYLALASRADPSKALRYRWQAARLLFGSGYLQEGQQALVLLLEQARFRLPRSTLSLVLSMILYRALLALRGLNFRERREEEIPPFEMLRVDSCYAVISTATSDPLVSFRFILLGLWYALGAGEPRRITAGLSSLALAYFAIGLSRSQIEPYLGRASELRARLDDPYTTGHCTYIEGHIAHFEGRWRLSSELFSRAEELLKHEPLMAMSQLNFIHLLSLYNLRWMGEFNRLAEELPPQLQHSIESGHRSQEASLRLMTGFLLHLRGDDPDQAETTVRSAERLFEGQQFHRLHAFALDAILSILLYRGQREEAQRHLEATRGALLRSGQLRVDFFRLHWLNLEAQVLLASGGPLARVERNARALAAGRPLFAASMAPLLLAAIRQRRGDTPGALALLKQAEEGFSTLDMGLHGACARLRRGQLLGGEEGAELERAAIAWMNNQGIRAPERMASMIAPV